MVINYSISPSLFLNRTLLNGDFEQCYSHFSLAVVSDTLKSHGYRLITESAQNNQ